MKNSNRAGWIAVIAGILVICLCFAGAGGALTYFLVRNAANSAVQSSDSSDSTTAETPSDSSTTPTDNGSTGTNDTPAFDAATATPLPPVSADSAGAAATLDTLLTTELPREDLADLAVRFKGVKPEDTTVSCAAQQTSYKVGATRSFTLSNQDNNTQFQVQARLEYATNHAYMWVETSPQRVRLSASRLRAAADNFESKIYPTTRGFFGEEASPGVDCDVHVHILHVTNVGSTVGGYFSSPDAYPQAVRADSNEGQMFVVNASPGYTGASPNSEAYLSTLSHEFQHMISANQTHATALWLEEGAAQLSERLNGYADSIGTVYDFASQPETQLNTWEESSAGGNSRHYGGGYLWWSYLFDRFGADLTQKMARTPERSIAGILKTLANEGVTNPDTGKAFTFEELFSDFVIANFMNREKIEPEGNRYNYATINVPPMAVRNTLGASDYPYSVEDSLPQFGTHYYELNGSKPVTIDFKGSTAVRLLPSDNDGGAFWWSNRADQSNPRLTREIDLSAVTDATLKFKAWYRLEKDYDYAYVSVSEDGGKTWKLLKTTTCTAENKQNANLGCGYNGPSGEGSAPQWVDESASLKEYAGKKVLLRFETITDAGVNREGLAIDQVQIPEIDYIDDADEAGEWQAEGWVRVDENALPQTWQVQAIVTKTDGSRSVQRMTLNNDAGSLKLDFGGDVRSAVLAVSPTTQVTTEPGTYSLSIK